MTSSPPLGVVSLGLLSFCAGGKSDGYDERGEGIDVRMLIYKLGGVVDFVVDYHPERGFCLVGLYVGVGVCF